MTAGTDRSWSWAGHRIGRYVMAAIGPIGSAITQFALSLVMLRLLPPNAFGAFMFLLVASQLSWGVWSALFCAPLPVFLAQGTVEARARGEAVLLGMNALGAIGSFGIFVAMALLLDLAVVPALCFGAYGTLALLRWFGRAYHYVHGQQMRTMGSDIVYSATVMIALGAMLWLLRWPPHIACYAALLAGAGAGLIPFGYAYARRQFGEISWGVWREYLPIFREQARWALLGVITTEATANAHVYLITLLKGPAAFAPIAASALLMRPVNVAQNALSDFERPQMARLIAGGLIGDIRGSLTVFRMALGAIWLGTLVLGAVILLVSPGLLFPPAYDLEFLVIAAILWAVVALFRLVQMPESTLMQAAGEFRPLAMASLWSSIGSVAMVLLLIPTVGTVWSIGGIATGAAIYLYWTHRYARIWLQGRSGI